MDHQKMHEFDGRIHIAISQANFPRCVSISLETDQIGTVDLFYVIVELIRRVLQKFLQTTKLK